MATTSEISATETPRSTVVLLAYGVDGGRPASDWSDHGDSPWSAIAGADGTLEAFRMQALDDANYLLGSGLTPGNGPLTVEVGFRGTNPADDATMTIWTAVDNIAPPSRARTAGRTPPVGCSSPP